MVYQQGEEVLRWDSSQNQGGVLIFNFPVYKKFYRGRAWIIITHRYYIR